MRRAPWPPTRLPSILLAALVLALLPSVGAGSLDRPDITDAAGDVEASGVPDPPWAAGMDLLAIWFTDDADGLHAHIRVADLEAVQATPAQVDSDAMFVVWFRLDHADKTGPGGRDGEWTLRADLQGGRWSYQAEGPCLDGNDADGCAGADRDIVDSLEGSQDLANSTVSIILPWKHLGKVAPGDGIHTLGGTTQFVYPTWPVYAADFDTDEEATSGYEYATPHQPAAPGPAPPFSAPPASSTSTPPSQSQAPSTSSEAPPTSNPAPSKPASQAPAAGTSRPAADGREAPSGGAALAAVLAGLAAAVRRRSA